MVSISKEQLEELHTEIQNLKDKLEEARESWVRDRHQIQNFDELLDKIYRAANGLPLLSHELRANTYDGASSYMNLDEPRPVPELSTEMWLMGQSEALREQSMMLAERLAAVSAIATFAKEHKA